MSDAYNWKRLQLLEDDREVQKTSTISDQMNDYKETIPVDTEDVGT